MLFDPHGPAIDAFLIQLALLPPPVQRRLARRVIYVDMSAAGPRVVPFPLLYALPGDSLKDQADRLPVTWRTLDPHLVGASIQGFNRLYRVAVPTGIVLAALGRQLGDAPDLLSHPEDWEQRLTEALDRHPEAGRAVDFFRNEYMPLSYGERQSLAATYLGKLAPFVYDPQLSRMFLTSPAGLDLNDVVERRLTVLLDFRRETNAERRLFKTRWAFDYIMAFIKSRGPGRHVPLGVHVDELTELTNRAALGQELFAADLEELISVYARNYSVWLTLGHQEMHQVGEKTAAALLTMGTQVVGVTANMETAKALVEQFVAMDVHKPKRWENVWGSDPIWHGNVVLERRPVDFPLDEQIYVAARKLLALRPFEFLIKRRDDPRLYGVNTAPYVAGIWPNEYPEVLGSMRAKLRSRVGVRVEAGEIVDQSRSQSVTLDTNHEPDDWHHPDFVELFRDQG